MKQFNVVFEFVDKLWIATCSELRITLEENSFDVLVHRIKLAIQEIAELELGHVGDIKLVIKMLDRIEDIKAVG